MCVELILLGQKWEQEGHLRDCCLRARRSGNGRRVTGEMMMAQDMWEVALRRLGMRERDREIKGSGLDANSGNCLL